MWQWTHRDIHPQRLGYDELWTKTQAHAAAVKAADPTAATLGPSDWGWCAYFFAPIDDPNDACANGPDRQAHGDVPLAEWYLAQARAYQQQHGVRLLDYFDEHYYPQANEVALNGAGDAARQALRLRTTRSLWDPSYQDESWIPDHVMLIPRMRDWVTRNYPDTKMAITEYTFGGLESINGALTQADVLGIFAREGVDLATLWDPPKADQPGAYALRMYRNYDGYGGSFGDTWARATSTDQGKVAVYAATRRSDGALTTLVVNKTGDELTSPLTIAGADTTRPAQVWRYSAANPKSIVRDADTTLAGGATQLTLPANSLTLLVLPPTPPSDATAPAAPTGLSATAGDGQPTVTWTAPDTGGSPITSYTVTAHHDGTDGPTTTGYGYPPAPHATLTGLTNGTAYTVTATNAVGPGPPSQPSAPVTPIGRPAAPTGVTAEAGDRCATVSWTPPADTGGSPITGYTVTADPGHITATTDDGTATSTEICGLTNGRPYTGTVTATNTVGAGPKSAPSSPPVIPAPSPDQVVRVTIDPDHNPSPVGGPVTFTVAVTKGAKPATSGAVALWDDTAQHYAAYGCPLDAPSQSATATTYTCTATFDAAGTHPLIASWDAFWPEGDHGQTAPYIQGVGADPPQPPPTPPTVTITSKPANPTNSRTATVAFTSAGPPPPPANSTPTLRPSAPAGSAIPTCPKAPTASASPPPTRPAPGRRPPTGRST